MFLDRQLTVKAAVETAGKVSEGNGKMPGSTFAISAKECKVGGKLATVKGSVCDRCYALKLQKLRPSVDQGWTANYLKATAMIEANPEAWAKAASFQISRIAAKSGQPFHRWFDSGDLQSVAMLRAICRVAELTPTVKHWLPTREAAMVKDYKAQGGVVPSNLIIRISATMIGDKPVAGYANTSTVHRKGTAHHGHACPASQQGNQCGECRACWSHDVANVSYPLH
jgi:hypothetical protein